MKATPKQLLAQYLAAQGKDWMPYFEHAAATGKTTRSHMLAIGSRETNLKNIRGDYRNGKYNGYGVMQVDIGTDSDYARQWSPNNARAGIERGGEIYAEKVADTLNCVGKKVGVRKKTFVGKKVEPDDTRRIATAAYNCGRWAHYHFSSGTHIDSTTTGADYSRDVYDRAIHFAAMLQGQIIETRIIKKQPVCRLIVEPALAVVEENALAREIKLQGKYCRPEHAALINQIQEPRESLPLALPEATAPEIACADFRCDVTEDLPADVPALAPENNDALPPAAETGNLVIGGETGTIARGDEATAEPKRFFDVENLKPFVKKWLKRIAGGFTGFNVAQFPTIASLGAKIGGEHFWWIGIALAVLVFLVTLFVAVFSTVVLLIILWINRKEIVHYKTLSFESMKDPDAFNVGLHFVHKGLPAKPRKSS